MSGIIRLMSDWGLYPFYVQEDPSPLFELTEPEVLQEMFVLPTLVVGILVTWDELYQDHLNWDDPPSTRWPSQEAQDRYVERGRAAARCLREHLPADVRIEYLADGILAAEYY